MVEVQDLIKILDGDGTPKEKSDAIIVRMGTMRHEVALQLIWDTGLWNATHPRKGSTANMRILDVVFHYYNDSE